ncbi:hypothetical protein Gorai_008943, partial [Gossypium raimondii]|nr:hypothetical protein [Gossypium raimondii]
MDVDSAEGRKASFKDMLMGGSEKEKSVGESLEAADTVLGERDVISGSVDGVPSIKFSKRVCSLLEKSTERTVIECEGLLNICYLYRRYGYLKENCSNGESTNTGMENMSSDRDGNKVVEEMVSKEDFGSRMVVEIDLGDILGKRRQANNEGDNNDGGKNIKIVSNKGKMHVFQAKSQSKKVVSKWKEKEKAGGSGPKINEPMGSLTFGNGNQNVSLPFNFKVHNGMTTLNNYDHSVVRINENSESNIMRSEGQEVDDGPPNLHHDGSSFSLPLDPTTMKWGQAHRVFEGKGVKMVKPGAAMVSVQETFRAINDALANEVNVDDANGEREVWEDIMCTNPGSREFDLDIVALLETKVSGGRARGIWTCWKSSVTMEVMANHKQFMVFHVEILGVVCPFFLTFVYGSPQGAKRRASWEDLSIVANFINSPWVIMGDF